MAEHLTNTSSKGVSAFQLSSYTTKPVQKALVLQKHKDNFLHA